MSTEKPKLLRITTVPMSLRYLLRGQMKFMSSHGFQVHTASADGPEIADVLNAEGVPHRIFGLTRKVTPWKDLIAIISLFRWVRKKKFDIVHSHTPKAGLIAMVASWLAGVPIRIHTVAGIPWMEATGGKRRVLRIVEKITYRFATHVLPNSYNLSQFIQSQKLTSTDKLKVLGKGSSNGIDTTFFAPDALDMSKSQLRAEMEIPEHSFVFCFVGRLVKDKGVNELVRSFERLSNDQLSHLVLVGPQEEDLDPLQPETLKMLDDNQNIHIMGYQDDVRPFLKLADALAFPSYREGFPNVPMQAGAMELPAIVSDINGCNEIVEHEKNGLIITPKNQQALFEAMLRMLTDRELYLKLKSNARPMIANRFEREVIWEELLKLYNLLLKQDKDV